MLRPERMSKVSVTGSKRVMDDVVDAVHELNLVHLSEYDDSWEGFESGDPAPGAEPASEKLVTIRSLKNVLGVDPEDAGPDRVVADEHLEEELERVRERANELDDRRSEIEDELRSVEDQLDAMDPFVALGIDLDLLGGYDTLEVAVGRGDADGVEAALSRSDAVREYGTFTDDDGTVVAAFVRPAEGESDVVTDALVGVQFEPLTVPDGEGAPEEHVERLRHRKKQLESELATVEDEIEDLRLDAAGFLLAAEEQLTIEVQKTEAPLRFATTKNSFVAEGWIPTERLDELRTTLEAAVGDHVDVEEMERARYTEEGHPDEPEPIPGEEAGEGGEAVATDGGTSTTMEDTPPVIMDNPGAIKPMELLTKTNGLPSYTEFDPTIFVFMTFPVFFGFMIGDLGYGILYAAIGWILYSRMDNDAIAALGGIAVWSGVFTMVFGVLYGEFFGLHALGDIVWGGHPPIHKGLQPHYQLWAKAWLVVSLVVGLLHVSLGHLIGFAKISINHNLREAVFEKGSWVLLIVGFWVMIFTRFGAGMKPNFIYTAFAGAPIEPGAVIVPGTDIVNTGAEAIEPTLSLGFSGLPASLGVPALAVVGLGFVMLIVGEGMLAIEVLQAIVNVLSYARLMAVLLAKAGMAFVVNLLVFGAYEYEGEFHFLFVEGKTAATIEHGEVMFPGLFNLGDGAMLAVGFLSGIVLLVVGHLFVLALGVTSAGLQAIRLEYVEFFGKFYDGGGRTYNPFGYSREHTTED